MSTFDVTAQLGRAMERRDDWSATMASIAAWMYAAVNMLTVDFDGDSGESWVRLIQGRQPVAYLNVHLPLLLSSGTTGAWPYPVVDVALPDLDSTNLRCDPGVLSNAFGSELLKDRLDPEAFTADGLWYATV